MSDDFFKKLLEVKYPDKKFGEFEEPEGNNSDAFFNKLLEFARECYIHGIIVGMDVAIEIYEENDKIT